VVGFLGILKGNRLLAVAAFVTLDGGLAAASLRPVHRLFPFYPFFGHFFNKLLRCQSSELLHFFSFPLMNLVQKQSRLPAASIIYVLFNPQASHPSCAIRTGEPSLPRNGSRDFTCPERSRGSRGKQETQMQFKQEHLKEEFFHLEATDPRLRAILFELDFFFQQKFGRGLLVTCVWRTEEEQQKLYPEFFARVGRARPSPHLDRPSRAVDLRSKDLQPEEIEALRNYFQTWWGDLPMSLFWSMIEAMLFRIFIFRLAKKTIPSPCRRGSGRG